MALGGAILAISLAAPLFRLAAPTHPLVIAGARLALAGLLLLPRTVHGLRRGGLTPSALVAAVIAGGLYGVHFGTWVSSLGLTTVAASVTLVTATPLLLAVVGFVRRRDAPTGRHWLAIGLALVGVTLIGRGDLARSDLALAGDGLALAGAAAMAAYLLVARAQGADLDVLAFQGVATAVGGALLLGTALVVGVPVAFASVDSAVYVALSALLPQLVGHTLLTWSLKHATPTQVGIATVGEPVGATLLAVWWLGEVVTPGVALGCCITLGAVLLSLPIRRPAGSSGAGAPPPPP